MSDTEEDKKLEEEKKRQEEEERTSNDGRINDSDIETLVQVYKLMHGKKFDEEAFRKGAKQKQVAGEKLSSLDPQKHVKRDGNGEPGISFSNGSDLSFNSVFENGKYNAIGSNGEKIEASSYEEMSKKIAQSFKKDAEKNGEEAKTFISGLGKSFPESQKEQKELNAKIFINEGVVVSGDVPNDPKFWNNFKKEYLSNKAHSEAEWDRLTRNIPPEFMGKDKIAIQQQVQEMPNKQAVSQAPSGKVKVLGKPAGKAPKKVRRDINKLRGVPMKGLKQKQNRRRAPTKVRNLAQVRAGRGSR